MSSGSSTASICLVGVALLAGACDDQSSRVVGLSGRTTMALPVGPTPGPPLQSPVVSNPFARDAITLNTGRLYFNRFNCSGCHGGRAGGGMGPSLRDDVWRYGKSDAQLFGSISEGRGQGMPAWGLKLPDEVIWKLVAYVQSLRTADEPEPPDQTTPPPPLL
jgi:cytochrome c oxidase cbb3-type subunit III